MLRGYGLPTPAKRGFGWSEVVVELELEQSLVDEAELLDGAHSLVAEAAVSRQPGHFESEVGAAGMSSGDREGRLAP